MSRDKQAIISALDRDASKAKRCYRFAPTTNGGISITFPTTLYRFLRVGIG